MFLISTPYLVLAPALTLAVILWYWRPTRKSISYLLSPPCHSWLVGNIPNFLRAGNAFETDLEWTRKYGTAFRYKGCFNEDVLYISDPKALQYILNKRGYNYTKSWEARVHVLLSSGRGITSVEGVDHARHRRVMVPSFSHSVLKEFIPLFFETSRKTTCLWKRVIQKGDADEATLEISSLITRTTLDAIGEAAFGYKFNAIEGIEPKSELQMTYENFFTDISYMPSDFTIASQRILAFLPHWLFNILTSPRRKDFDRLKAYKKTSIKVAKKLLDKKMQAHASGQECGKDVMSLLVNANSVENPRRRLDEEEVLHQITVLLIAGHETTANTLGSALYELSKRPDSQRKLRSEIRATRASVSARGDTDFTMYDLDTMKYMIAVMKETLRYHPIVSQLGRIAVHDDIIPLDTPARKISGGIVSSIPIRKGQQVKLGVASYNRYAVHSTEAYTILKRRSLKSVWGEDADEWRPERFLEENTKDTKYNLGVYGNLATFGSGIRSCIGWRFAVLEFQILLMGLVDNFEFSPAPNVEIKSALTGFNFVQSMVKGQESKGKQLPLTVSVFSGSTY